MQGRDPPPHKWDQAAKPWGLGSCHHYPFPTERVRCPPCREVREFMSCDLDAPGDVLGPSCPVQDILCSMVRPERSSFTSLAVEQELCLLRAQSLSLMTTSLMRWFLEALN